MLSTLASRSFTASCRRPSGNPTLRYRELPSAMMSVFRLVQPLTYLSVTLVRRTRCPRNLLSGRTHTCAPAAQVCGRPSIVATMPARTSWRFSGPFYTQIPLYTQIPRGPSSASYCSARCPRVGGDSRWRGEDQEVGIVLASALTTRGANWVPARFSIASTAAAVSLPLDRRADGSWRHRRQRRR